MNKKLFPILILFVNIYSVPRNINYLDHQQYQGVDIFFLKNRKQQKSGVGFCAKTYTYYQVTITVGVSGYIDTYMKENKAKAVLFHSYEKQYFARQARLDKDRTTC